MIIDNVINDGVGFLELQDVLGNDLAIVNAARVSFLGESKGEDKDRKLLHYLWKNKHTSPFEMAILKIKVHCPLFVRSQWMRHRTFSYNEVSRRYTSEKIEFYFPQKWRFQDNVNKQGSKDAEKELLDFSYFNSELDIVVQASTDAYNYLLDNNVAREMARMVLPQNLYTTFIAIGNLRNWLHFIELRSDEHAQWEIRQYSNAILNNIIKDKFPWTYEEFINEHK